MNNFKIKQIQKDEYGIIRKLDRDAFQYNERNSDGDFHEVFADNIRRSPYYIPELDLVAVTNDDLTYLGHAIFSALPMGDNGEHIIWLNSLAVRHGENDNHAEKIYAYQRKGIGTALVMCGLEIAKSLGYTGCMTCGHPAVYQKKMGFPDCRELGIGRDESVDDPEGCVFAIELVSGGFEKTSKLISYAYYDFAHIEQIQIKFETLTHVLSKMLSANIIRASYRTKQLQGGTPGDVRLVTGIAESINGKKLPYKVVLKIQKKWERSGDPDSWRREYDLYTSDFSKAFTDSFRWPEYYHAEMNSNEIHLWIEYIDGISGDRFDIETLEFVATELGRFQGKIYKQQEMLRNIKFLSEPDALSKNFEQWHTQTFSHEFLISDKCRLPGFLKQMLKNGEIQLYKGKSFEYGCLRSHGCDIPEYLKQMLFDIDDNREALFNSLKSLPVVLCHRDFWVENIFLSDGEIRLIDWDCAGFGYLGEDIASLIYDDTETENLHEYFRRLIPAYIKGISEYLEIPQDFNKYIQKIILIVFGYRIVQTYMFTESPEVKEEQVKRLQKIYEMRYM